MKILNFIFFILELPQNLLGLFQYRSAKRNNLIEEISFENNRMFIKVKENAICLGFFIFWSTRKSKYFNLDENNKMHEYGHSIQSRIFGPFYLIIIGIPSISRVLYAKYFCDKYNKRWFNYYKGFPENWADKLGKVRSTNL